MVGKITCQICSYTEALTVSCLELDTDLKLNLKTEMRDCKVMAILLEFLNTSQNGQLDPMTILLVENS